jgi:hypothetical protein
MYQTLKKKQNSTGDKQFHNLAHLRTHTHARTHTRTRTHTHTHVDSTANYARVYINLNFSAFVTTISRKNILFEY